MNKNEMRWVAKAGSRNELVIQGRIAVTVVERGDLNYEQIGCG